MSEAQWSEVDEYLAAAVMAEDPILSAALAASAAAGLPAINVSPLQGKFLMLLAQMINARSVLEIGTLGGYSTIWLARALPADGSLVSLELERRHAEVARANLERAGLEASVEVRLGRAIDSLAQLQGEDREPFDLVFIDADKASIPDYLTQSLHLTRVGSVFVVDNVVRDGEVANAASTNPSVLGVRRMFEMLADDERLNATAIQTVGTKGYDGFALARVVG